MITRLCKQCKLEAPFTQRKDGSYYWLCDECHKAYRREEYRRNNEGYLDRSKHYYEAHKDDPEFIVKRKENWYAYKEKHPDCVLHRQVRNRARRDGIVFELTREDCAELLQTHVCACCGISDDQINFEIDRLIPAKGYVKGNVKRICSDCNRLKSNGTIRKFLLIIRYMIRYCLE